MDDPQMIYEHGEPTGHTSWGPDPEPPVVRLEMPSTKAAAEAIGAAYLAEREGVSGVRVEYQDPGGTWTSEEVIGDDGP